MTELPSGIERRSFDGDESLATQGPRAYGEPVVDGWRQWSRERSKLAGMLERSLPIAIGPDSTALYLGAASGTTVSHVADVVEHVYAVEFAARPASDLLEVANDRENLYPLLADARQPSTYAHVVESDVDLLIQDVATRGQAAVALANRQFLADDGQLVLAITARSEDVAAEPSAVFEDVTTELESGYEIVEAVRLEPQHVDHLAVVAEPR